MIFCISVDGIDCKIWEPKHPTLNQDKQYYSKKFNHAGVKYELGIDVNSAKLAWINGPFKASVNDKTIFKQRLSNKLKPGKLAVADRGYID